MSTHMIATAAAAATAVPGAGQFLGVDWSSIAEVLVVTLVATLAIVTIFSVGLRLLSIGSPDDGGDVASGHGVASAARPLSATLVGWLCVGIGAVAVLYGIYLVVPLFHMK